MNLLRQGRFDEAIDVHLQVVEVIPAAFSPDHPYLYFRRTSLGLCLTGAGRFDEAQSHLLAGHANLIRLDHPKASWAREALEDLYKAWDRPDLLNVLNEQRSATDPGSP